LKTTIFIIEAALALSERPILAYSGGADSTVLMDVLFRRAGVRIPVFFVDSGMEYEETEPFIKSVCAAYGAELFVVKADREPLDHWHQHGWPMLGKLAARHWTAGHKGREMGFRIDVSGCCRTLKISPGRKFMRQNGYDLQFVGMRGNTDDSCRGLRFLKDGATRYLKTDRITVCSPLTGWTDLMVKRYTEQNRLLIHPARLRGACTIGCMFCGGGSQFTNSGFRVLRKTDSEAWRRFMVDIGAGEIVLSLKYDAPLSRVQQVVDSFGGLAALAAERPWIFDFSVRTPLRGYTK
jgi:3'-phosphoadenosine 5'-phosphosulfate sulfotransferase (PAPS reductase)/FAD synthetase